MTFVCVCGYYSTRVKKKIVRLHKDWSRNEVENMRKKIQFKEHNIKREIPAYVQTKNEIHNS